MILQVTYPSLGKGKSSTQTYRLGWVGIWYFPGVSFMVGFLSLLSFNPTGSSSLFGQQKITNPKNYTKQQGVLTILSNQKNFTKTTRGNTWITNAWFGIHGIHHGSEWRFELQGFDGRFQSHDGSMGRTVYIHLFSNRYPIGSMYGLFTYMNGRFLG